MNNKTRHEYSACVSVRCMRCVAMRCDSSGWLLCSIRFLCKKISSVRSSQGASLAATCHHREASHAATRHSLRNALCRRSASDTAIRVSVLRTDQQQQQRCFTFAHANRSLTIECSDLYSLEQCTLLCAPVAQERLSRVRNTTDWSPGSSIVDCE